jgi:hypothetical protein
MQQRAVRVLILVPVIQRMHVSAMYAECCVGALYMQVWFSMPASILSPTSDWMLLLASWPSSEGADKATLELCCEAQLLSVAMRAICMW